MKRPGKGLIAQLKMKISEEIMSLSCGGVFALD